MPTLTAESEIFSHEVGSYNGPKLSSDSDVVELPLLLPRWQVDALEEAANQQGMTTTSESDDSFGPLYEPTSWVTISDSAVSVGIKGITAWSVNEVKVAGLAPDHNGIWQSNLGARPIRKGMLYHNSIENIELGKAASISSAMVTKRIDATVAQFAIVFTDLSAVRTFPAAANSLGRFRTPRHRRRLSFPLPRWGPRRR